MRHISHFRISSALQHACGGRVNYIRQLTASLVLVFPVHSGAVHAQRSPGDSAALLFRAAQQEYRQGSPESLVRSLQLMQEMLPLLWEAQDRRSEGLTLYNIGDVHTNLGRPDSALTYYVRALGILREVGARPEEAITLSRIGEAHKALIHMDSALVYYNEALLIAREVEDRHGEAVTLFNIGAIHGRLGHPDSALHYYADAVWIQHTIGDLGDEGITLSGIGSAHAALDHPDSALAFHTRALRIARETQDRRREGITLYDVGSALRALNQGDSALAYYSRALAIELELREPRNAAVVLSEMGRVHSSILGHPDSAVACYARALAIWRELGELADEALELSNIGTVYQDWDGSGSRTKPNPTTPSGETRPTATDLIRELTRPDFLISYPQSLISGSAQYHRSRAHADSALAYYGRAAEVWRRIGNRRAVGSTLNNIAHVYRNLGRSDSALIHYRAAFSIAREVDHLRGQGTTLANIGVVHLVSGRPDSARLYLARALPILRRAGPRSDEAFALYGLGAAYLAQGRADSALVNFDRALTIQREVRDRRGEGKTLTGIGQLYQALGRYAPAMTYFRMALPIHRETSDRANEGQTLLGMGMATVDLGQPAFAMTNFATALKLFRETGDRRAESHALNAIGAVHHLMDRADSALVYHRQALAVAREMGDRGGEANSLNNVGVALDELDHPDSALTYFRQALSAWRETGELRGERYTLTNIGHVYHRAAAFRDLRRAVAYYDSAAAVVEDVSRSAGGDENRWNFIEQAADLYELWPLAWLASAREAGEANTASAALAASERGRARALQELMHRNRAGAMAAAPALQHNLRAGADLPAEGRSLAAAVARVGVTAVSYVLTPDTLLAFLIQPGQELQVFRTAVWRDSLASLIAEMRAGLDVDSNDPYGRARRRPRTESSPGSRGATGHPSGGWQAPAARLAELLLPAELRARLPAAGELVIVPAGPLNLLSFAALPLPSVPRHEAAPTSFLGLRYALRYVPSLQVLADLEARPARSHPTSGALVVGDPIIRMRDEDGGFFVPDSLPGARAEARWVADSLGTRALLRGEATEAAVRVRVGTATLVHLATHAEAYTTSDARARDSYIALSSGLGQDGLLTAGEVLDEVPEMKAELVVLSGCQTGLGDLKQAEGTIGLQRAFLAKGARRVLVSLWSVNDEATKLLMQSFYRHWLGGDSPAEALRRAQVELARDSSSSNPRFWAAFQMAGAHWASGTPPQVQQIPSPAAAR